MTKKQIAAITRIANRSKGGACARPYKSTEDKDMYLVTDCYVGVCLHDCPDGLPVGERADDIMRNIKMEGWIDTGSPENDAEMAITQKDLAAWKQMTKRPPEERWTIIESEHSYGYYNPKYIVDACEAIGKNACLNIGHRQNNLPFLIVFDNSCWNGFIAGETEYAFVLPVRVKGSVGK